MTTPAVVGHAAGKGPAAAAPPGTLSETATTGAEVHASATVTQVDPEELVDARVSPVGSLENLADCPLLGITWEVQNKQLHGVRMWHVKGYENYLIFYAATHSAIEVIRIVHGSRDIEELFA